MSEILITSSVLILAVILLRLFFRNKVSRRLIYGAWLLVALRLLIPVQIGNLNFSILAQVQPVTDAIVNMAQKPVSGPSREDAYDNTLQDYLSQGQTVFIPEVQQQVETQLQSGKPQHEVYEELLNTGKPEEILLPEVNQQIETEVSKALAPTFGQIAAMIWIVGMIAMAAWFTAVNLSFRRKLRSGATNLEVADCKTPVKVSSHIASPCLFGLLRPTVYLTPKCVGNDQTRHHVLTHELTHLRSGDHIWSWVRCICLCVYWFNPLVWVAASLSRRDCELACDETALKTLGDDQRIAYGKTLLDMVSSVPAPGQLLETATAMHETKKQLKERMRCIVKKPKAFLTAAIVLLLVLTIVTGCTFSGIGADHQNPGDTIPTTPNTTTTPPIPTTQAPIPTTQVPPPTTAPTPTTIPTVPTTVPTTTVAEDPELAYFNALFSSEVYRNYYFYATGHTYTSPTQISLKKYFDGGFSIEERNMTDSELSELEQLMISPEAMQQGDFNRLPKDKINAELIQAFGITLEDLPESAFDGLLYLESTDCYYLHQSGMTSLPKHSPITEVEHNADGTVSLSYNIPVGTGKLTLKPNGEGWLIVSNIHDPALI